MGGEDWRSLASRCLGPSCVPLLYRNRTLPLGVPHGVGYPIKVLARHHRLLLVGLGRIAYRPPRHAPAIYQVAQRVPSHHLLPSSYPTYMVHVPAHGPGSIGLDRAGCWTRTSEKHLPRCKAKKVKRGRGQGAILCPPSWLVLVAEPWRRRWGLASIHSAAEEGFAPARRPAFAPARPPAP
jgi:hypothetical protein